ncbi:AMP-binding protein [Actinosynnema mirum]|uniref:AMP-dependent synthetase and ligase n=1 Tax=Actinosynnema mirum (strain ATCC 29888 / DSM 43827 / JCM 3225 / NBRC 14064 / NCIMB 13271 / NRRL B-12336 / IMRU 3971 / 101) TaxID=446462 RepID=C6WNV5_ACTMD|nr:AMP-binding protein [Actinosynnema mirum]ACU36624.1 AMP-dependent synthetase and ligase [Actinosynnema mirum DSM 43827]
MALRETDPVLHARFLRGLAANPDGVALRLPDGREVAYRELHELALSWAGALWAAGSPPVVGVLAGKTLESYAGLLAVLYSGATAVPLHPEFPASRTRRMLDAAGVSALLVDEAGLTALEALGPESAIPVHAPLAAHVGDHKFLPGADPLDAPVDVRPESTAYVLFTSGSTGRPKGVPTTHASADHYFSVIEERFDFTSADRFSQSFDLNFDCAVFDLFCAWGAGAQLHPIPGTAYRDLPAFVAERGLTVWFSTPSAITLVRRLGGLGAGSMPGLRWSLFAGEALRQADAQDWLAAASGSGLENIYGPTELTITITGHRWGPDSPSLCLNGLTPIGEVHAGHDWLLLGEDGEPDGVEGELCVTGAQLTAGYLDPSDDVGRFLEHGGRRWYRTGDRVRRHPDGTLVYLGRLDSQVQLAGWRVELAEVEHALRGCDGVLDAVAVTRQAGDGLELVVYYTGSPTPARLLSRELRDVLPKGMVPRDYRHVAEFPLNSNRKVDRGELTRMAAS